MKTFPELPKIKRCHDYKITTKFTYRCTRCGYSVGRHSKSLDVERKRCGHCYGKFELLMNKVTKSGKVEMRTPVAKKPTGFALFVKENYSSVKKDHKGVPHKEVMQILGQQFSAIKITKKTDAPDDNDAVSNDWGFTNIFSWRLTTIWGCVIFLIPNSLLSYLFIFLHHFFLLIFRYLYIRYFYC